MADTTPSATAAHRIALWGGAGATALASSIAGQGIEGTAAPSLMVPQGGSVVWRVSRERTDELGMRHVFYRQRYLPTGYVASLLEANITAAGIELAGSDLGLHYRDGRFQAAFGTQFPSVTLLNEPIIGSADDAWTLAMRSAVGRPGFAAGPLPDPESPPAIAQRLGTSLLLMPGGAGSSFRFVWRSQISDAAMARYVALLDAGTAEILALDRLALHTSQSCSPVSQTQEAADGTPQNNGEVADRSIWATEGSNHDGFTHEAARAGAAGQLPPIEVYFGTTEPDYACDPTDHRYAMVPLKTTGGTPTYDDWTTPVSVPGRAAADAVYHTYLTMQTFADLGWYSYDDMGSTARVVVNDLDGANLGDGCFIFPGGADVFGPEWGVRFGAVPWSQRWSHACSLDVVAHEWGHAVVASTAGFDPTDEVGGQLHEGFSDVIGYAVERYRQPDGTDVETRDWGYAEDNDYRVSTQGPWIELSPFRWVDELPYQDVAPNYPRLTAYNHTFHRLDFTGNQEVHDRGNMLPVAFRLLAAGDQNPICVWPPWEDLGSPDCDINVTGVGLEKATKILFRTLTSYAYSTMAWPDIADIAKAAAFDLYSVCPAKNGGAEQTAANRALGAIGYPGTAGYYQCP